MRDNSEPLRAIQMIEKVGSLLISFLQIIHFEYVLNAQANPVSFKARWKLKDGMMSCTTRSANPP